jgi:hypothetical protein
MQAFLLAPPAEPIYASFPPGFEDPNGKVMYLLKNLYGSTTAPFMFNNYLSNSLIIQGFTPNEFDPCLFTKMVEGSLLIVLTYVDDSIAIHQNPKVLEAFYNVCGTALGGSFKFGQLEQSLTRFLGFDIYRDEKGFILTQIPLIEKIFAAAKKHMTFGSENQPTTTPIAKDTILESSRPINPDSLTAADKASSLSLSGDSWCHWLCCPWNQTRNQLLLQDSWSLVFELWSTTGDELTIFGEIPLPISGTSLGALLHSRPDCGQIGR